MQEMSQQLQDQLDEKEVSDRVNAKEAGHRTSAIRFSFRAPTFFHSLTHSLLNSQIQIAKLEQEMKEASKDHERKIQQLAAEHVVALAAKDQAMQDQAVAMAEREAEHESAMAEFRQKMEAELLEARTPPPSDEKATQCDTIGVRSRALCFFKLQST